MARHMLFETKQRIVEKFSLPRFVSLNVGLNTIRVAEQATTNVWKLKSISHILFERVLHIADRFAFSSYFFCLYFCSSIPLL